MEGAGFLETGKYMPTKMALTSHKPFYWGKLFSRWTKTHCYQKHSILAYCVWTAQWLHTPCMKKYAWDHADDGDAAFEMFFLIQEWVFVVFYMCNLWMAEQWLHFLLSWSQLTVTFLMGTLHFLGGNLAHLWQLSCMSERSSYKVYDILVHGVKELIVKLLVGVTNAEVPWGWNWCTSLFIQN
jgi:uncharacterized protein (DUF983 family)